MQKMPAPLRFIEPMECLPVEAIPDSTEWQYELKLDGYRTIAVKDLGEASLFSRHGNSFDAKFPRIADALLELREKRFVLDGEIVALDENGRHSFDLLQRIKTSKAAVRYYVFDLLKVGTDDLLGFPLLQRRKCLEEVLRSSPAEIQLSPILQGNAAEVLEQVRNFEFEGVVAKRLDSIYHIGETPGTWQKRKTQRTADFLVGGYILGNAGVDELVVGEKRGRDLYFLASVKNGFVPATRRRVLEAVRGNELDKCPFVNLPEKKGPHRMDREKMRKVRWLKPTTLCEVAFNERTAQGHLRHSKFLRLREPEDARRSAK